MEGVILETGQAARSTVATQAGTQFDLFLTLCDGPLLDPIHERCAGNASAIQFFIIGIQRQNERLSIQLVGKDREIEVVHKWMIGKTGVVLLPGDVCRWRIMRLTGTPDHGCAYGKKYQ